MSKRKYGKQIECYFCLRIGFHKIFDVKNNPVFVCKECQDLIEITDAAYDAYHLNNIEV